MSYFEPAPSSKDRELTAQEDLGYITPSKENAEWMKKHLAGESSAPARDPRIPDEDWRISDEDREIGKAGIEKVRQISAEHKIPEEKSTVGMSERRMVLEAQHLQSIGAALTPQQQRVLTEYYRKQENQ